jgi:hypothetical protein
MDYTGFTILWQIILLLGFISGFYYMITHLSTEWTIIVIIAYLHCFFLFISFFPVV